MNLEPRRSSWRIGLLLLVAVVAVLVVAFVLNRQLRPRVGTEAVLTATVAASPPVTPGAAVQAASPMAQPVAASATPVPTPVAIATATPGATPLAIVEAPGATPASPATVAAIEHAYLRYWEVYGRAVSTLDPSHLGEVMTGTELTGRQKQIADLQAKHQSVKVDVSHSYVIVVMGPTKAAVEDRYLNKSVLVDATTGRPLQNPGSGVVEDVIFHMELTGGAWKVVVSNQVQP